MLALTGETESLYASRPPITAITFQWQPLQILQPNPEHHDRTGKGLPSQ